MATATSALPDEIDALKAMVSSMRVELTAAEARASAADALVAHLKQQIALLLFDKYGQHQPLNRQAERLLPKACRSACRRSPTRSAQLPRR